MLAIVAGPFTVGFRYLLFANRIVWWGTGWDVSWICAECESYTQSHR